MRSHNVSCVGAYGVPPARSARCSVEPLATRFLIGHSSMAEFRGGSGAGPTVRIDRASSGCGKLRKKQHGASSASWTLRDRRGVQILHRTAPTTAPMLPHTLSFSPIDRPYRVKLLCTKAIEGFGGVGEREAGQRAIFYLHCCLLLPDPSTAPYTEIRAHIVAQQLLVSTCMAVSWCCLSRRSLPSALIDGDTWRTKCSGACRSGAASTELMW